MKNVSKAILAVMKEVGYVQKEKKSGVRFMVKTEQAVIQALRPAMLENNLIMVPVGVHDTKWEQNEVTNKAGKTVISNQFQGVFTYRFIHITSGESLDVQVMGAGESRGDDKAPYMGNTGSKKYALLNTFLLETGDDPDDHDHENEPKDTGAFDDSGSKEKDNDTPIGQEHIDELDKQIQQAEALGIEISEVDYGEMNVGQWRKAWSLVVDSIEANQKPVDEDDIPF